MLLWKEMRNASLSQPPIGGQTPAAGRCNRNLAPSIDWLHQRRWPGGCGASGAAKEHRCPPRAGWSSSSGKEQARPPNHGGPDGWGLDDVDQLIGGGNGGCARTRFVQTASPAPAVKCSTDDSPQDPKIPQHLIGFSQAALGETTRSGTYIIPRPGVPCFLFPPFCRFSFHSSYAVSIVELLQRSIEAVSRVVVVTSAGT
ncbi:hypothetical protein CPLU01_02518 [Colletotrichum plurivorum]|uniref:Uncharacterized protein n=1 Tax=Colletotrichum plurivorum TaxID=2175906 RepID=A0A8H6KWW1_9PEZI|nr:hypothetical protein CPLU01_02518 [Colletotrichum plurivorum]